MTGALPRALALIEADVLAGRRALGGGRLGRSASALVHACLGALTVALAVGVGAVVAEWRRSGAAGAAAGSVDVLLATLFAASVMAPLLGSGAARVRALAAHCTAPTDGGVLLLASVTREAAGAPLGPALCLALGAALGHTLGAGPFAALHAMFVTLALASLGVGIGSWLAEWAAGKRHAGAVRVAVAAFVVTLVAVLAGGGLATPDADLAGWLAGAHETRAWAVLSPSSWAASAIVDGGTTAWWAPAALVGMAAWSMVGAMRGTTRAVPESGASAGSAGAEWWRRLDGVFGALVAKDLVLLRRDAALRVAVLRHAMLAAVPVVMVLHAAVGAAGNPVLAARVAQWLPDLGLLTHLFTVAMTGVVVRLSELDRGGARQMSALPLSARRMLLARAVAWTATAGPAVAIVAGALVLGTAWLVGAGAIAAAPHALLTAASAALEAGSSVAAGAGAGLLAAALMASLRHSAVDSQSSRNGGSGSVVGGLFAALLTLSAVAPIAVSFHVVGGVLGTLTGGLLGPLLGGLAALAAAGVEQARSERGASGG